MKEIGVQKIRKRIDKGMHLASKMKDTLSYSIFLSNNYILFHIFNYMEKNLFKILKLMNKETRLAFYAGLIDAEGHIGPTHLQIDIWQNDRYFLRELKRALTNDGLFVNDTDRCIKIYLNQKYKENRELIKKIAKYIKNSDKKVCLTNLLAGNLVKPNYVLIAKWIELFPNQTTGIIARKFGQSTGYFLYHKLTQLVKQNYIERYKTEKKGEFRYKINPKGKQWVEENKEFIEEKIKEIVRYGSTCRGMYSHNFEAIKDFTRIY